MKKLYFIAVVLVIPLLLPAQEDCRRRSEAHIFNSSRIKAPFYTDGTKFFNFQKGHFEVPYPPHPDPRYRGKPNTITAAAPWIGSFTDGRLRLAAPRYTGVSYRDYYTGPLNPGAIKDQDVCHRFDTAWIIFREDIVKHMEDYQDDHHIESPVHTVFGWPAEGNDHFELYNGFSLPPDHQGGWADFRDVNENGKYEPDLGEYPIVRLRGKEIIPDKIMWMVYNDQGFHLASISTPLGVEMQLTVFAFSCEDNELLNHTLFNTYKIINQNDHALDSVYFGIWNDYDVSCAEEHDFMGCDSLRNTEFVYHGKPFSNSDLYCYGNGYAGFAPIQSMSYLSHPMYGFVLDYFLANHAIPLFNQLKGKWHSGEPVTGFGSGLNPGMETGITRFLFHGDPRDSTQWSEWTAQPLPLPEFGRKRTVSSVYLGSLLPYQKETVETAYMYHRDSTLGFFDLFGYMYDNIDDLLSLDADADFNCTPLHFCTDDDCVWPGDSNHDGVVSHTDLLYWGVMKDAQGPERDGRIAWRGYFADNWSQAVPGSLNYKHGDADGNGVVDNTDLMTLQLDHFGLRDPNRVYADQYPEGDEVVILSDPMDAQGGISNIRIRSNVALPELYGLAFELVRETFPFEMEMGQQLYEFDPVKTAFYPVGDNMTCYSEPTHGYLNNIAQASSGNKYAFVRTDHIAAGLEKGFTLLSIPLGIQPVFDLPLELIPDDQLYMIFRLKNLVAIDAEGRRLPLGARPLYVPKYGTTSVAETHPDRSQIYPNPCTSFFILHTATPSPVEIYSVQGVLLRRVDTPASGKPIDVSGFGRGMFVVRIAGTGEVLRLMVL